ncbi:hypothetical protein [Haloferula sp. A504]|uniref:hypothetical protein n=1 Tax=Haloferula sp. A504 TaxID=3373601 RepID=UPI0031BFFF83|nr:hypothetical protein [Verrucomicrobiaceae bacterium E54]
MKPATLPILCGAALAIMAGAAGSHFASVKQLVALAEASSLSIAPVPTSPVPDEALDTRSMIAELRRQNEAMEDHLSGRRDQPLAESTQADSSDLHKVLAELVAINRELRSQIAETNRDLMELRFQVDTHSEQFRPLNTVAEPVEELDPYDPSIGILPPLDLQ